MPSNKNKPKLRLWKLLPVLSLALMTSCEGMPFQSKTVTPDTVNTHVNSVWPDQCVTAWLITTPHPACVSAWKDRYVRQQCLLDGGGKECDR